MDGAPLAARGSTSLMLDCKWRRLAPSTPGDIVVFVSSLPSGEEGSREKKGGGFQKYGFSREEGEDRRPKSGTKKTTMSLCVAIS